MNEWAKRQARVEGAVAERERVREELRGIASDLYERMDLRPCLFDREGDCANWRVGFGCVDGCPIVRLRELAGIEGQADGNLPRPAPPKETP